MTSDSAPATKAPRISGLTMILVATVIAGVITYFVTWVVPRQIGFANYATFALYWSFLYLLVGALSGIQQEVARGTGHSEPIPYGPALASRARKFGLIASVTVFVAILASAAFWEGAVFPQDGWALVLPLAVGAAAYVMVAVLGGSLYGISGWSSIALMIVVDAALRVAALTIALQFSHDVVVLAWTVALPFPLALAVVWPIIRRTVVGRIQLDVGYGQLTRNVAQTVLAAAATGVMVSGFPLVLGLTSRDEAKDVLGLYILCITLTRAPLIIVLMSLQSYLVVTFRNSAGVFAARFIQLLALIAAAGLVLALVGGFAGPAMFALLFPGELVPDGWLLATLVFSSALVGALCLTGPAVLSRSRHAVYSTGWVAAAAVTVLMMLLPIDFRSRVLLVLLVGPVAGLVVHGAFLLRARPVNTEYL